MDGWVIIGTKLDSKQLEKDLKQAEQRLRQYEKESEKLTKSKAKAEVDLQPYEEQKRIIQEMTDEMNRYAQTEMEVTKNLEVESQQIEELNNKYSKQLKNLEDINSKIQENAKNQGLVKNEIQETNKRLTQAKGYNSIKESVDNIGKSMNNVLKKVTRWGLAIIGIRTAYNGVRNAISLVSSKNEEIASQFDVMKNALANALLPLVQQIVDWLAKMMVYINYIVKSLTGKNLFDFDKAFEDAKDNANKTEKSVKNIKKQLAGFDEMNVLSDTTSANNVGVSKIENPFIGWEGVEIPGWIDKVVEFGRWVIDNWEQVVGQLLLIKLVIDLLTGNWIAVVIDIIAFVILGITQIWQGIKDLWDSLVQIFGQLAPWILDNVIKPVGDFFANLWDAIKKGVSNLKDGVVNVFVGMSDWFYNAVINPVKNVFTDMWNGLINGAKNAWEGIKNVFSTVATFFKNIFTNAWTAVKNVFSTGGKIFTGIKDGIVEAFKKIVNTLIDGINKVVAIPFNALNSTLNGIRNVDVLGVKPFKGLWGQNPIGVPKIPKLAVGGLVNMPGRGVPVGNAITGESGVEGVIPLTDSQAMETLGATIGKYITINANITNTMNGRVISRELQRINNNEDFAFNR